MPKAPKGDNTDNDIQAIGHQIGSLASVLVVAAVQFGIPLTPGQQSSILSVIAVAWAFFATIYSIRNRIPHHRTRNNPNSRPRPTTPPRTPPRHIPRNPGTTRNVNGTRWHGTAGIDNGSANQTDQGKVP